MMKKLWVILLTVAVFLSVAVLSITSVYRVDTVTLETNLVSEEAKVEAENIQTRLENAYEKDSIFFADDKKAQEIVKEYPYFRISAFEKAYPNRLVIVLTENAETYAVEKNDGGYYVLSADGTILTVRNESANPLNGEDNVVFKGLNVSGELSGKLVGDDCFDVMLQYAEEVSKALGGIRRNVASIEVYARSPELILCLTMKEGVKIYVSMPNVSTLEKAQKAVNEYMLLSNAQKLTGKLVVLDGEEEIIAVYSAKSDL